MGAHRTLDQVRGGDAKRNAEILLSVLKNEASPFFRGDGLGMPPLFYANGKILLREGIAWHVKASGRLRLLQENKMSQEFFLPKILKEKA